MHPGSHAPRLLLSHWPTSSTLACRRRTAAAARRPTGRSREEPPRLPCTSVAFIRTGFDRTPMPCQSVRRRWKSDTMHARTMCLPDRVESASSSSCTSFRCATTANRRAAPCRGREFSRRRHERARGHPSRSALVKGRIQQLETLLTSARCLELSSGERVQLGSTVTVADLDSDEPTATYRIVGSFEANPRRGLVQTIPPRDSRCWGGRRPRT